MSLSSRVLSGNAGVIQDQITAGVIHMFWNRSRAPWGEEVALGALISGWPDGTSVKFLIFEKDEGAGAEDDAVEEVEASIDKCLAHAKYKIEFEDPDNDEGAEYELYFLVEVDGEVLTQREDGPLLYVDLTMPWFSE